MNIVIDVLPINHLSGRHVVSGHIRMLAKHHADRHQFYILHHYNNRDIRCDLGENVYWIECPNFGENWLPRLWWQLTQLSVLLEKLDAHLVISTSGALVPGAINPQIVIAQNPWCYIHEFHGTVVDKIKAWLQRYGYRQAQKKARAVFYLSQYVADLYRKGSGIAPQAGDILYVGIDDATYDSAQKEYLGFEKRPLEILTVSAMTPHKVIEDVIQVLAQLHQLGVQAQLSLVGPWSTHSYRCKIEALILSFSLQNFVTITGKVPVAQLHEYYRRARIFCLLSRSESFGIPAIEAQTFGTPTVVANLCAPPEVAGPGGVIIDPSRIPEEITLIQRLLTDHAFWNQYSSLALINSERFRWNKVSQPLVDYLSYV